jgi:hypothetical protein
MTAAATTTTRTTTNGASLNLSNLRLQVLKSRRGSMKKSIMTCMAALALLSAAAVPSAALGQSARDARRKEEVIRHLKKARSENRRVTIRFKSGADVTGLVGELRERGLTFEPDGLGPELRRQNAAAVILYEDVASVQHPSKVRSFFKKVGYGLALGGAFVVVAPLYGLALLIGGGIPSC